jgi:hypothetical protein
MYLDYRSKMVTQCVQCVSSESLKVVGSRPHLQFAIEFATIDKSVILP